MKLTIQAIDSSGNLFAGEAVLERVAGNGKIRLPKASASDERASGKIKCPFAIERLWKNAKFKKELSFADVKMVLAEEGYNFPRNTLMMALQSAAFLTRRGGRGNYTWTQKHPFAI